MLAGEQASRQKMTQDGFSVQASRPARYSNPSTEYSDRMAKCPIPHQPAKKSSVCIPQRQ